MKRAAWLLAAVAPAAALFALPAPARQAAAPSPITWKKTVLDKAFRSEGVAVADVNKDGKLDVLNGECWYEAPDWKRHEIRPSKDYTNGKNNVYSNSFACWADDLNGDGYPDLIVVGFPGAPCHWFENPKGGSGHWKKHEIWHSACNETPQYLDLLGDGKKVLLMGWQPKGQENMGQMAYFTPDAKDPTNTWTMHPVSAPSEKGKSVPGTHRFAHGLGAGDVNGDGRTDVITVGGWWEQPAKADGKTPWAFHACHTGESCADIYAVDVDGDGKPDLLSSSAHGIGIWWHRQAGKNSFQKHDLFPKLVSQTHAMVMADVNGDGLKDFVTGKRWWAHGPGGDVEPMAAPKLFWFEAKKGKDGMMGFTPHEIDDASGVGTQFAVTDVNGDGAPDVVVSNKRGTFLFEQVRPGKASKAN